VSFTKVVTTMTVIAFDGDDTLWKEADLFLTGQRRFGEILRRYGVADAAWLEQQLHAMEHRNLLLYGYGVKRFVLSMIETAIEITAGRVATHDILELLKLGREMVESPLELIVGARDTLERLHRRGHCLWLITKGDLFDQEMKVARSGLAALFERIEIVAEKDVPTYRRILQHAGIEPTQFTMVGNSLRSDVLPVLQLGGRAVHVPYHTTWTHERALVTEIDTFITLDKLTDLMCAIEESDGPCSQPPAAH
jgi:putative hydrolase of the HAD superfamily